MKLTESHIARNQRVLKIPKTRGRVTMVEAQAQYDNIKNAHQERSKKPRNS